MVGQGGADGMNSNEQEKVKERFNKGDLNVLVSTSVLEEGFDLASCHLVIRYSIILYSNVKLSYRVTTLFYFVGYGIGILIRFDAPNSTIALVSILQIYLYLYLYLYLSISTSISISISIYISISFNI